MQVIALLRSLCELRRAYFANINLINSAKAYGLPYEALAKYGGYIMNKGLLVATLMACGIVGMANGAAEEKKQVAAVAGVNEYEQWREQHLQKLYAQHCADIAEQERLSDPAFIKAQKEAQKQYLRKEIAKLEASIKELDDDESSWTKRFEAAIVASGALTLAAEYRPRLFGKIPHYLFGGSLFLGFIYKFGHLIDGTGTRQGYLYRELLSYQAQLTALDKS
jgi:hypothetical protein